MSPTDPGVGNGPEYRSPMAQRVGAIGESAEKLYAEAKGAVHDLNDFLDIRGRVQRHPYGMVLAAAGIGYVLGGGLFTPFTARLLRLSMRLAALPFVKDELLELAEAAVEGMVRGAQARSEQGQGPVGTSGT